MEELGSYVIYNHDYLPEQIITEISGCDKNVSQHKISRDEPYKSAFFDDDEETPYIKFSVEVDSELDPGIMEVELESEKKKCYYKVKKFDEFDIYGKVDIKIRIPPHDSVRKKSNNGVKIWNRYTGVYLRPGNENNPTKLRIYEILHSYKEKCKLTDFVKGAIETEIINKCRRSVKKEIRKEVKKERKLELKKRYIGWRTTEYVKWINERRNRSGKQKVDTTESNKKDWEEYERIVSNIWEMERYREKDLEYQRDINTDIHILRLLNSNSGKVSIVVESWLDWSEKKKRERKKFIKALLSKEDGNVEIINLDINKCQTWLRKIF